MRERRRREASKIAARWSTTKPQGKANRRPPPLPSRLHDLSNDRRVCCRSIFQYSNTGGSIPINSSLTCHDDTHVKPSLSTWGEIDDRLDKWVLTAFLSVSPGCSSLAHDGWRSMYKIGKLSDRQLSREIDPWTLTHKRLYTFRDRVPIYGARRNCLER